MGNQLTVKAILVCLVSVSLLMLFYPLNQEAYALTETTSTFLAMPQDGYIYASDTTYIATWYAGSGTVASGSDIVVGGQFYSYGLFFIYRAFLLFDTSAIPAGATVTNATLSVYVQIDNSVTDFNLTIMDGQPVFPHNPLQAEDFYFSHYSGNGGNRSTSEISGVGYWNITMTSDGYDYITQDGVTKLALRSSRDIISIEPSGYEAVTLSSRDKGESYAAKLYVTYEMGAVTYLIHGPYYENGQVAPVLVNLTLIQPFTSDYAFILNGSDGVADTANLSLTNPATYVYWNLTSTGNYTRIYYFLDTSFDELWIFVPYVTKPWFSYQFSVTDFFGMTNPYLETTINVAGQTRIVERKPLTTVGTITFSMVQWQQYGLRFRCDEGTYTQYFSAETTLATNLQVLQGSFPTTQLDVPITIALRLNGTSIQITYTDPSLSTNWFFYNITHEDTLDSTANLTTNSYSVTWTNASSTTDYEIYAQANINGELYDWLIQTPAPPSTVNPWEDLFESLGTWPTGFNPMYIPAAVIIVFVLGIFSYYSATIGCGVAWIVTGILMLMGWYDMGVSTFAFAAFVTFLVAVNESKKTEREL